MALINFVQLADALDFDSVAVQHVWEAEDDVTGQIVTMYFDIGTSPSDAQSQMGDADTAEKPPPDPIETREPLWQYNTETKEYCVFGDDGLKIFAIKRDADGNAILTMFDVAGDPVPETVGDPVVVEVSVRATRTAGQTIANDTNTDITFPSEDYDVGGLHDTAINPDRITIPTDKDGLYSIMAGCSFAANATGFRFVRITVNGVLENQGDQTKVQAVTVGGANTAINVARQVKLVVGDIVRLSVRQTSGGNLSVTRARIEVAKIG